MTGPGRYPAERLAAPDGSWQVRYAECAAALLGHTGDQWQVEHVGSTSVPGLVAKPVIDLALRVPEGWSTAAASAGLRAAGWTGLTRVGDHRATYLLVDGERRAIGHAFSARQWPEAHVRLFADWLRAHPDDRDRYAALKEGLVARGVRGAPYTEAKGGFVLDIVNQARRRLGLGDLDGPL